eukprot:scaffold884_cov398-Prasinococcus_capsulatus_cf.AAC.27
MSSPSIDLHRVSMVLFHDERHARSLMSNASGEETAKGSIGYTQALYRIMLSRRDLKVLSRADCGQGYYLNMLHDACLRIPPDASPV